MESKVNMMKFLQNATFNLLEKSLDVTALRQKVIANNIANVDTPNFKRSEVRFEQLLRAELKATSGGKLQGRRTHERHLPIGARNGHHIQPQIHTDERTIMNNNLNNVDIEMEMAQLAQNQIAYNTLIQQMNHELRQIRTAIGGNR